MDADEDELLGRRRRRRWIVIATSLPFIAAMAGGIGFFLHQRANAHERSLVDQITGAAIGCVASLRGDAPEAWSLPNALEHMARMGRVARGDDPSTAADRERFARLATDAANGCEQLGSLMRRARERSPHLYFAVPAKLAQPPNRTDPSEWYRRVLPQTRAEALTLTRQIEEMAAAINARRSEHALMATELPVEGQGMTELARVIELAPIPRNLERPLASAWPLESGVFVLRRGSLARVPCDTRYLNPASCYSEFAQTIAWSGELGPQRALERPASVSYWSAFTPTMDGSLWAIGADTNGAGVVGRYPPDATAPQVAPIEAAIDADANIVTLIGGVAVFPSDGSAWFSRTGALAFAPIESTPPPVIHQADQSDPARGVRIEGRGELSLFGSEQDGWTSRLSPPSGADVLRTVLDAHSRVRRMVSLRALDSGKAVALLQRFDQGPDAVVLTTDFGRTWLAAAR